MALAIFSNSPPEVTQAISAPFACASFKAYNVSSVFPEYEHAITKVFLFTNDGNVYVLLATIATGHSLAANCAIILPPIPEPPKPVITTLFIVFAAGFNAADLPISIPC